MATGSIKKLQTIEDVSGVLTSSKGTFTIAQKLKFGNFVMYTIRMEITSAVSANSVIVSGIETMAGNIYGGVSAITSQGTTVIYGDRSIVSVQSLSSGASLRFSIFYMV